MLRVPISTVATFVTLHDSRSFCTVRQLRYVEATHSYRQWRHKERHSFSQRYQFTAVLRQKQEPLNRCLSRMDRRCRGKQKI